jgi:hypothetical protein
MATILIPGNRPSPASEPVEGAAEHVAADFDATVVAVGSLAGFSLFGQGVIEIAFDVVVQGGLVVLHGEQVVGATFEDGRGDLGLATHRIDGDQRTLQFETLEQ